MNIAFRPYINNNTVFSSAIRERTTNLHDKEIKTPKKIPFSEVFLSSYLLYRLRNLGKESYSFNYDLLEKSGIPNLHPLNDDGVRGSTLSGRQGRKFIPVLKKAGIKNVIDLRGGDASSVYEDICKKNGLKYYHIPIDSESMNSKDIIEKLPELFDVMNKGKFYIACAQGLHRTDIAVAMNYLFNPKSSSVPPKMYGHISSDGFKQQGIFNRTNSIFKNMTQEDKNKLGLSDFSKEDYKKKKKILSSANEKYAKEIMNAPD